MVSGVQDAPPKNPDALAFDIEERHRFKPPALGSYGKEVEPGKNELDEATVRRFDGERFRKNFVGRWFGSSEELSKEAALGKQLMAEDITDGAGTGMRFVEQIDIREVLPCRGDLVRLADVGVEQVLKKRVVCFRDAAVRYRGPGITHVHPLPFQDSDEWNVLMSSICPTM